MTVKTPTSPSDDQDSNTRNLDNEVRNAELEALRSLIDQRRAEPFIDLDEGEAEIYDMLKRKGKAHKNLRNALFKHDHVDDK